MTLPFVRRTACHSCRLAHCPNSCVDFFLCAASAISRRSRQTWRSDQLFLRQLFAPAGLDGFEHLAGPVDAALHLREQPLVDKLVALDIVAHAARRIEVDRLERPHERPAQGQAVADADIDVLDCRIAIGDQPEGLLEKRALHAVHDEAVELALHDQRRMAGRDQERARPLHDLARGPGCRHDFGRGDEIGRVDRVDDEAAMAVFQMLGEFRGQQAPRSSSRSRADASAALIERARTP